MEYAQVIRVPYTLEKLKEITFDKDEMESICANDLGPDKPAQCLSARFLGQDGEPLLLYFGRRVVREGEEAPVCFALSAYKLAHLGCVKKPIDLKDQYIGRTVADYVRELKKDGTDFTFDGLHVSFNVSMQDPVLQFVLEKKGLCLSHRSAKHVPVPAPPIETRRHPS